MIDILIALNILQAVGKYDGCHLHSECYNLLLKQSGMKESQFVASL